MDRSTAMMPVQTLFGQILELYLKCYQESSPHKIKQDNATKYMMQLLSQFEVITEKRNDRVVGCIVYQKYYNILLDCNECYVHEWFIAPEYRKKSIGHRLYMKLCSTAVDLGCKRMRGFSSNKEMIKTIDNHDAANDVAIMFEKDLTGAK